MLEITQRHPLFVGEVRGVDLRHPLDPETLDEVVAAADKHAVLVFPDQAIDDAQQLAFSERLGPLESTIKVHRPGHKTRLDPRVSDISNLDETGAVVADTDWLRLRGLANRLWHTDSSFKPTPAKYSLLSARAIPPEGGETEFADLRAAYDALPDATKRQLEGLVAMHSIIYSRETIGFMDFSEEERAALKAVPQVIVRRHPGSGRMTLYLASHAHEIHGMSTPDARLLLRDLIEHATQREFVYTHQWRVGDLVMWDDRCTMHRAREHDNAHPRDMHRTTVSDVAPTLEQVAVA